MECSFYSFEYWSASDYRRSFEVSENASVEHVPDIHRKNHQRDFVKISMNPGSFLFIFIEESSEEDCISILIQAPTISDEFEKFCKIAEINSGEKIYNEDGLEIGKLDWIDDYVIKEWREDWCNSDIKRPYSMKEAITLL